MSVKIVISGSHSADDGQPTHFLNQNYAHAVVRAGGLPLLAVGHGPAEDYAELGDGLLLAGGRDLCPYRYGQEQQFDTVEPDPLRDEFEFALIRAFVACGKPIFGICRGMQILNVYFGGQLWQDLPAQLGCKHVDVDSHPVTIVPGSLLYQLFGAELTVNTYHHQAVSRFPRVLIPTAYASAGETQIVEAFAHDTLPVSAVQWHPERMTGDDRRPAGAVDSLPLFEAFIRQCREQMGAAFSQTAGR